MTKQLLVFGNTYTHTSHKKFTLTVIKREGHIIMAYHPDYGYEVFKVRLRMEKHWPNGSITPAGEYPPSTGEFGKAAVHYPPKLYHAAIKVFDIYVSKYNSLTLIKNIVPNPKEEIKTDQVQSSFYDQKKA